MRSADSQYAGYKRLVMRMKKAGVDNIICYTAGDPLAHHGWSQALGNDSKMIRFLADPEADFANAYNIDVEYKRADLGGLRRDRFSMLVEDGVVRSFHLVSDANH